MPILGVCLGHQCIGHVFGGEVVRNYRVMHGKTSPIHHDGQGVFRGLSNPFEATRYHSLVIRRETFHNPDFVVSAWTDEGEIMGVRHRTWPLHGVQFHPESFLTAEGPKLLQEFRGDEARDAQRSARRVATSRLRSGSSRVLTFSTFSKSTRLSPRSGSQRMPTMS